MRMGNRTNKSPSKSSGKSPRRKPSKSKPHDAFYTITTLKLGDGMHRVIERSDLVGWFWSEKEARKCVEENGGDWIETGYYDHAVVERHTKPGLYQHATRSWWYKAVMPKNGTCSDDFVVKKCKQPKILDTIGGYGAFG